MNYTRPQEDPDPQNCSFASYSPDEQLPIPKGTNLNSTSWSLPLRDKMVGSI